MASNRIIPIAAGFVLVMLSFIGLKSCEKGEVDVTMEGVPQVNRPDVDSTADTLRSLTAEVDEMKTRNEELIRQNTDLLKQKDLISQDVELKIRKELKNKPPGMARFDEMVGDITQQLDFFESRMDDLSTAQVTQSKKVERDIPIGFGLEGDNVLTESGLEPEVITIKPLGSERFVDAPNPANTKNPSSSTSLLHPEKAAVFDDEGQPIDQNQDVLMDRNTEKPVYTVPRNSTLIGSTSMTALIGRIPFEGVVQEPFPFKVIVGKDNLATNGIDMPQLDGMIFSGTSSGDWALSCVRGTVHSVTYVFTDGTIRTLSSDETGQMRGEGESESSSLLSQSNRPLGWISDRRGIPCVTGKRISNAKDYLTGRILASAASAAAGAFSQSETTNVVSPTQGTVTSVITGDSAKHAGYKALSGGAEEVADYIRERAAQSFDVVYVDTGVELAVHVDIELAIDYETKGRKTNYEIANNNAGEFLD